MATRAAPALTAQLLAARVARDLRHRLDLLTDAAVRVRRQRLRAVQTPGGRLALAHATDAEAIHDLRVAARRLTAGLRLWRPALAGRPARRALRLLRRARRRFGPLRESEVHTSELARRTRDLPRVPAVLVRIAVAWRERYARDRRAALERIEVERLRSLRLHLEDAIAALDERVRDPQVAGRVRRRLATDRRSAHEAILAATVDDDAAIEPFHAARVAVKKWRYSEERWHAVLGTESRIVDRLREIQEALGKAHDHATLRQAVTEVRGALDAPPPPPVAWLQDALAVEERTAVEHFRELVSPLLGRGRRAPDQSQKRSTG